MVVKKGLLLNIIKKSGQKDVNLARNNYAYEKRQRDLAKKKKKEEKKLRKLNQTSNEPEPTGENEETEDVEVNEADEARND